MARDCGFDVVGVARARDLAGGVEGERLRAWLRAGRHGTMAWMAREPERRLDPGKVLPGARSVVMVGLNYWDPADGPTGGGLRGRIARYARGADYHRVFEKKLRALGRRVTEDWPEADVRAKVDHGPVLEKVWAERAGLGWRGKHTNLVSREYGSWLLLGVLLTTLDLEPDDPETDHCGTCTACLDACPTGAFPAPYEIDARRCLSYLTIEHSGPMSDELDARSADWLFGCDVCLAVCPWNRFERPATEPDLRPRPETAFPVLEDLRTIARAEFQALYRGTPLLRAGWERVRTRAEAIARRLGPTG